MILDLGIFIPLWCLRHLQSVLHFMQQSFLGGDPDGDSDTFFDFL